MIETDGEKAELRLIITGVVREDEGRRRLQVEVWPQPGDGRSGGGGGVAAVSPIASDE